MARSEHGLLRTTGRPGPCINGPGEGPFSTAQVARTTPGQQCKTLALPFLLRLAVAGSQLVPVVLLEAVPISIRCVQSQLKSIRAGFTMTLVDFIDVSSDEEIQKGHELDLGTNFIDLSRDDKPTWEHRGVCGQGHAAHHQALPCDPTVFISTDEGSQQDLEPGNAAEAAASFLVTENEGVGTATSLNFHQSSTAVISPCKEYRVASQTAAHGAISTSPKAPTPETPSRRKTKDKSQQKNKMRSSSVETSSSNRGCSLLVDSPFSEAPSTTWSSPRLKKKHEGNHNKSMIDLAVELKSSTDPLGETTSVRRKQKDKSQQKNKMCSSSVETTPSKRGCSLLVDSRFSEADAVAAQAEEVDQTGSLVANP
ncbi:hypothetical protein EJB05_44801, partial [Eragrostis curvula]